MEKVRNQNKNKKLVSNQTGKVKRDRILLPQEKIPNKWYPKQEVREVIQPMAKRHNERKQ